MHMPGMEPSKAPRPDDEKRALDLLLQFSAKKEAMPVCPSPHVLDRCDKVQRLDRYNHVRDIDRSRVARPK